MKTNILPEWLTQNPYAELPECRGTWSCKDYIEKTLHDINKIMSEDANSVMISGYKGIMQQIEPHIKLVGFMALILSASLTKSIAFLGCINMVILFAALLSGIGLYVFGIRVWVPTLLFVGVSVLPGIISWITPGEPVYTIYTGLSWHIGSVAIPGEMTITKQGVQSALFVILRTAASLGLATLLMKTTRWSVLTRVLAKIGLSSTIISVLDMTYRYIYLFLLLLMEYLMGRKSRLVGVESQSAKISWIGGTITDFLRITREYSQEINHAMQSRGYYGEHYAEAKIKIQVIDICFLAAVTILCYYAYGGITNVRGFGL